VATIGQLLSFDTDQFIAALAEQHRADVAPVEATKAGGPRQSRKEAVGEPTDDLTAFSAVARDMFGRLLSRADNRGVLDEHRALNYVALKYRQVYEVAFDAVTNGMAPVGIEAHHLHETGDRRLVDVRLTFRSRRTDVVQRFRCRVDVTEMFPFLVTSLEPTYD
jgi:hypothetical protein